MFLKLYKKKIKGFTLAEMLIVLLIISVLLLLFVPNISKQKDKVEETGSRAVVKVVESQRGLYELNGEKEATLSTLISEGYITEKQAQSYRKYAEATNRIPD